MSNKDTIEQVRIDLAAMYKKIVKQDARNDYNFWLKQVAILKEMVAKDPNNAELRAQLRQAEINLNIARDEYNKIK